MTFALENSLIGYLDHGQVLSIPYKMRQNMLALGEIGSGKSSILRLLILQDIKAHRGFLLMENHSELSAEVLSMIPPEEYDKIVYVNLSSIKKWEKTLRFNPLENDNPHDAGMVALNFTECLAKAFADSWGARVETCSRNGALGVIGTNSDTIGAMLNLLTDKDFRETFIPQIQNRQSKDFFNNVYDDQYPKEAGGVIFNKLNKMLTIPELDAMFNVKKSSIDFKRILDDGKYVIIDLGGGLPDDMVKFLGNVFMHLFYVRYKKRQKNSDDTFAPFNLYLDEVHMLSAPMVYDLLNTVRKYGIKCTIATQSISSLDKDLEDKILSLCRSVACFRCDPRTALHLKSVLPISPEKQQQLSFHYFSFYSAGDKPIHAVAKTRHLNIPARQEKAAEYSVNKWGEYVSLEKYYVTSGGNTDVLLTPLEFGILNLLRLENRDMTKDEIIQSMKRRYAATSRQVASALLDTLMATKNFVAKKDVTSDDGDDKFESRYVITNAAIKRIFSEAAVGRRSGGALHLAAIFFIMNVQMNLGRYCIPDLGKTSASKADLTIFSPKTVKNKNNEELYNPSEWSEDPIALEVEASPGKHTKQIPINWEKNIKLGNSVWFVVFNEKDRDITQKALYDAGIEKKNYALQVFDKNVLDDDSVNSTLRVLSEVQSVIYEIIISEGGKTTQNTILEKAYRYEQKNILDALVDLQSKKRLARIGNPDANLENPGAKIIWSLSGVECNSNVSGNVTYDTPDDIPPNISQESQNISDKQTKEFKSDDILESTHNETESFDTEQAKDIINETKNDAQNDASVSDNPKYTLDKNSLSCLTEQMLFSIWESHMDNDELEQAKRISDEIDSRGFVIRERNGTHHISKKPQKKK
jgi:hypothetical protein